MICEEISGWFPPPVGIAQIKDVFGDITLVPAERGGLRVKPQAWEVQNMMVARDLPGCPRPLYINKKIYPMLRAALSSCAMIGGYKIKTIGCFCPRYKRGIDGSISTHAWSIAVDINADDNPLTIVKTAAELARAKRDIPNSWVDAFENVGFYWGGRFSGRFDPGHFQYCKGY